MLKRKLSHTGLSVSAIGLGTVKFGRNQGVKYPTSFSLPTDAEIKNLLSIASDLGINLLDTAPAYGMSEERLGKALLSIRNQFVISTKVGEEFIDGVSRFNYSKEVLRESIHRSLKRLRTDYIDIVLIHSDGNDEKIIEQETVFLTLDMLKQEGKIRAFGMSTKTLRGGMLTIEHADVAMVAYNPNYTDEREVISFAHQCQKSIFIKKGFASGHLQTFNATDPIAHALKFIFSEPGVTSVIVGTINPIHLRENVEKALEFISHPSS